MDDLSIDGLEFLLGLVTDYLENELDLNQREWGFAKGVQNLLTDEIDTQEFIAAYEAKQVAKGKMLSGDKLK